MRIVRIKVLFVYRDPRAGQHQALRRVRNAIVPFAVHVLCVHLHDPLRGVQAETPRKLLAVRVVRPVLGTGHDRGLRSHPPALPHVVAGVGRLLSWGSRGPGLVPLRTLPPDSLLFLDRLLECLRVPFDT